jgi:hypothetical protein
LLFENLGNSRFSDVGRPLRCDEIAESRGVAIADLNKDGKLDIVINNNAASPTIYLNRISTNGNFFRCNLKGNPAVLQSGRGSSRDAVGARVEVDILNHGERESLVRLVEAGSGFASQSEATLHFGLGDAVIIEEIRITWPSGRQQTISGPSSDLVNREVVIEEGRASSP